MKSRRRVEKKKMIQKLSEDYNQMEKSAGTQHRGAQINEKLGEEEEEKRKRKCHKTQLHH